MIIMTDIFDVIVIGGGPGGYVCSIRLAQGGLKVASVEYREFLGGTCLNEGCIPSKSLLNSSYKYDESKGYFENYGVKLDNPSFDLSKIMEIKDSVVNVQRKGLDYLFKSNKIERFHGYGELDSIDNGIFTIKVSDNAEGKIIKAKNVVFAMGSSVANLPNIHFDEDIVIYSKEALTLKAVPKKLGIIGAGVIGLEMASIWSRLGSKVSVFEYCDMPVPTMDGDLSKSIKGILQKHNGIEFNLATKVDSAEMKNDQVSVSYSSKDGKSQKEDIFDKLLVCVGRKPNHHFDETNEFDIKIGKRGQILVNDKFQIRDGLYAIGDLIDGPMLAHKAEDEAVIVADIILGKSFYHTKFIPSVIYTHPEVASIGKTEEELKQEGIKYNVGKAFFKANGRAQTMRDTDGFVKVLINAECKTILGVHIIGAHAGTMIAEAVLAMEYSATAEDITLTSHSHPDLPETFREACFAAFDKAIHA